jgi:hypothetical protein
LGPLTASSITPLDNTDITSEESLARAKDILREFKGRAGAMYDTLPLELEFPELPFSGGVTVISEFMGWFFG